MDSNLYKFGVKLFITNASAHKMAEFIPIFQGWIQRQALPDHLLIDVHDYSHVPNGPGILLVSHEANLNIDESAGRRSLQYIRKQPAGENAAEALRTTLQSARAAAQILTEDQDVKFESAAVEIFSNDRLLAPNDKETAAKLQPLIAQIASEMLGTKTTVTTKPVDPRERLTFVVNCK